MTANRKGFFDRKNCLSFFSGFRNHIKSVSIHVQHTKHSEKLH